MLISSCTTNGPAPVVIDTSCNWVNPILLAPEEIQEKGRLTKQTKRAILAHNIKWDEICNKNKSTVN